MAKEKTESVVETPKAKKVGYVQYAWAYNTMKLKQVYAKLVEAKLSDSSIVIDEETVKEAYIANKGLLAEEQKEVIARKRPRSTSNIDR